MGAEGKSEGKAASDVKPELRAGVVIRDIANVVHPLVASRDIARQQLVVVSAKGSTIVDADGREYLDAMAGLWCVNIGYGRTELADVAADQMRDLAYYPHTAMNAPAAALAEQINRLLGGDNRVYFVNSGSEANEAGFKFVRQYMRHEFPGELRYKIISRYFSYHGTTFATLAAGGQGERTTKVEPLANNAFVHVAPPYCYRCPFGLKHPSCALACVDNMETTILGEGPESVAEILIEPVMSGLGAVVPPDGYIEAVAELCRKYGLLLHVDEVINGFGRTGTMFGHQHWGVSADIVSIAKGVSSAYMPIAATVVKNRVFQSFDGDAAANRQVQQVNTYGGHAAAAAVASRNIEIILEEKLAERAADNGRHFLDGLQELRRHPTVGDVRGKGLLVGVELVLDGGSREPMPSARVQGVVDFCRANGVIVGRSLASRRHNNTIVMSPPLVITAAEVERIVAVLDKALDWLDGELGLGP
jgi:adenosylmethionine-8-amino-7-oxononanoate aminotransferase